MEQKDAAAGAGRARNRNQLVVVGIGASAGGLEAFQSMLPNLPDEDRLAYVIVQHLDPKHPTMLISLLERYTDLPVVEIQDGQTATGGRIYVTPPDRNVTISESILHLSKPTSAHGPKPSINRFLKSLAEDRGDRAVAVILSGTGSDGSHGVRAVKAAGGITVVQSRESAKYDGMPHAAISAGPVDLVVTPDRMGGELISLLASPAALPVPGRDDTEPADDLERVFDILRERTGCDFSEYKISTVNRRIGRRMALRKVEELSDYIAALEDDPEEVDRLSKDILISVTSFFRDKEAFDALAGVLERVVKDKKKGDPIRVWAAGCATGEEAYSVGILLSRILNDRLDDYNVQIFGTDLDGDAIESARWGGYPEASVAEVDPDLLDRYFHRKENGFQIDDAIREIIVFARHDLIRDPPYSRLDLITCRNVFIYFNARLQERIAPLFHYVLNPQGYLMLGKSENVSQFSELFETVYNRWKIYRRRSSVRAPSLDFGHFHTAPAVKKRKGDKTPPAFSPRAALTEAVADAFGPTSILLDSQLEIVYIHGDVEPYLSFRPGSAGLNVLDLARDQVRLDLRTLIHRCRREKERVESGEIRVETGGKRRRVVIHAQPLEAADAPEELLLVAFEELGEAAADDGPSPAADGEAEDPRIYELEQELASTREHLQTTVEELETSNEELMSLNEEVQSANEELQSSNEELETSNEELQSTNEELTTVNQELQVKSAELSAANADLENILGQIEFPLIMVDKDLRVRRFNGAASEIFDLGSEDMGESLTTTALPSRVDLPDLRESLMGVVKRGDRIDREVRIGRRIYAMRCQPYRVNGREAPSGALLSFVDKTRIAMSEREKATIGSISQLFLKNLDLAEIYQSVADILADRFGVPVAAVTRYEPESESLLALGSVGLPGGEGEPVRLPVGGTIGGTVVKTRQPVFDLDAGRRSDHQDSRLKRIGVRTVLVVPMLRDGDVDGTVGIADFGERQDLESAVETLQVAANHLAQEIDRQEAARDLQKNRNYMEQVADAVPMVLYVYHIKEKRNIYINRQVHHMLGYSREEIGEMGGDMFSILIHPDDTGDIEDHLARMRKASDDDLLEAEYRVRHADGGWRWLRVGEVVFRRDHDGRPQEILGTGRDITEQKALEDRLEHSEALYRTVLEDLPDMVCRFTEDRRLTVVNNAYARSFGKTPDSLIGQKFTLAVLDEDKGELEDCLEGLTRAQPTCAIEIRVRAEDDAVSVQQWIFRAFFDDDGNRTEYQGTARDVTRLKEAEKQRAQLREKELLLREVHHRVKNNLQMVSSMLRLQSATLSDEGVRDMLADNVNRIASMSMIHEKLYRSESLETVDLAGYIRDLVKDLFISYRSGHQNIRLETDIEPVSVSIDTAIPCGLVVNELLANAMKHGFDGAEEGSVRVALGPSDNGGVRLTVSDDGGGLPADFDMDAADTIGLKLVRGLVEQQLEGDLTMDTEGGVAFHIRFKDLEYAART